MPEGDTLHRTAAALRPALVGRTLTRFSAPRVARPHPPPGTTVRAVEAVGKHLLIEFSNDQVLRTHLRMKGSWHLYAPAERWHRPAHQARVVLEVADRVAVCFSAPVVELTGASEAHRATAHLGPDLCASAPHGEEALLADVVERMARAEPRQSIAEVLLDQRIAAGIGNVYKSEVLWACRVDPFLALREVTVDLRCDLIGVARRLLRANLVGGARTTVPGPPGSLAVYGRRGRPCLRCGTPVRSVRHGEQARSTYWCPRCQQVPAG